MTVCLCVDTREQAESEVIEWMNKYNSEYRFYQFQNHCVVILWQFP